MREEPKGRTQLSARPEEEEDEEEEEERRKTPDSPSFFSPPSRGSEGGIELDERGGGETERTQTHISLTAAPLSFSHSGVSTILLRKKEQKMPHMRMR